MVAYKLSKYGWVMTFFVIFRLAREKLLVTVTLDPPVCYPAHWIETFTPFCESLSLFLPQLRLTASQTKIFGPKIIVSPHMLSTGVTNERKEQCRVKLVMLTFME